MQVPVYPDVNTSEASNEAAYYLPHRERDRVYAADKLSSPVLLGLALAGSAVAALLLRLVNG